MCYFPTISTQNAITSTKSMIRWLNRLFDMLPLLCLPYMYFDLNSGIGVEKVENLQSRIESDTIGGDNLAVENAIGKLVHVFLLE